MLNPFKPVSIDDTSDWVRAQRHGDYLARFVSYQHFGLSFEILRNDQELFVYIYKFPLTQMSFAVFATKSNWVPLDVYITASPKQSELVLQIHVEYFAHALANGDLDQLASIKHALSKLWADI